MSGSESDEERTLPEPDLTRVLSVKEREIIARLYHFLTAEYEYLRSLNPNGDLTPLVDVQKRTAEACGVTVAQVMECVKEFEVKFQGKPLYNPLTSSKCRK